MRTEHLRTCVRAGGGAGNGLPEPFMWPDPARRLAARPGRAPVAPLRTPAGTPIEGASPAQAGSRRPGSNSTEQMAVTLSERRKIGPIVARARRRKLMEKFVIEGGAPLSGTHGAGREQERRAADPRLERAHGRGGGRPQRAADPRRRGDARDPARDRRRGLLARAERGRPLRRQGRRRRDRPRARRADPRLVPAGRPAARPLPPRGDAAARRRRDRSPPSGPAPRRLPSDGRASPTAGARSS